MSAGTYATLAGSPRSAPDVGERHLAALDHVDQAAGRGDDQVRAALNVAELVADLGAAVDDARPHEGAVGELGHRRRKSNGGDDGAALAAAASFRPGAPLVRYLARLVKDLAGQLARRREDERVGVAAPARAVRVRVRRQLDRAAAEQRRQDGEQEAAGLAGA